ncbi:MAG: phage tail tube protein [Ignavibacteria bacterium]|nr:phage tail tube protein [Ignavibacteria bacterium]
MAEGVAGFGTKLTWNTVNLAELTNISGPSETMDTIDVSSHDSADRYKEFVAGLRDGGDISLEGNFIKGDTTGQVAMYADFQAGTKRAWIVKMPGWAAGKPQIAGDGFITAFAISYPYEDKISFTATIKLTGKPTLTLV